MATSTLTSSNTRLDPSTMEDEKLAQLMATFSKPGHVAFIDAEGQRTEIPEPFYHHLMRLVRLLNDRQAIVMIPEDETFTTQAAANYLGMSRQFLIDQVLDAGQLPFHRVGKHRRIYFRDLLAWERQRDEKRRIALDELRKTIDEAGFYDASYTGDAEG
ncbi:MAG: excisionase family DNA-binding protein [Verrucomicrobiota bacterium JB022]|nr:excisionase family DNA-binding protein [Verrucomicrobiota bacterium JB022]